MTRYKWEPADRSQGIGHGASRAQNAVAGEVVELDESHAKRVNAIVLGVDGKPALVAVTGRKPRKRKSNNAASSSEAKPDAEPAS